MNHVTVPPQFWKLLLLESKSFFEAMLVSSCRIRTIIISSLLSPYLAKSDDRQELPLRRSKSGNMINSLQHSLPVGICKSLDFIFSQLQGSDPSYASVPFCSVLHGVKF